MNVRKRRRRDRAELALLGLIIVACYLFGARLLNPRHAAPPDSEAGPGPAAGSAASSGSATASESSPVPTRDQAGTGPHALPDTVVEVPGTPEATTEIQIRAGMEEAGPEAGAPRRRRGAVGCLGTDTPGGAPSIQVHVPGDLEAGARPAVDDLVRDLSRISDALVSRAALPAPACTPGEVHIAVLGHGRNERGKRIEDPDLEPQAYAISESRCGCAGRRVVLRGGSLLSGQWAIYDLLTRLGVRYFHPEQTLYPERLSWPAEAIHVVERPALRSRILHVHRTIPMELLPPGDALLQGLHMAAYQRRWIDWNIKIRQTAVTGWNPHIVGTYAYQRGFPRHIGVDLLSLQQDGQPVIAANAPPSENQLNPATIDALMAPQDGMPAPSRLQIRIPPSAPQDIDAGDMLALLTRITDDLSQRYPEVDVYTVNHGIWQEPGPFYEERFPKLLQSAPSALGVRVRPFMFYDLERPADMVYDDRDYHSMRNWLVTQQRVRRIEHAPGASRWPTFALAAPLYLAPVILEARQYDIDLLTPFLAADDTATRGVYGHRLRSSGQEWGYWLIDYCVAQMTWSLDTTYEACLRDVTSQLAGGEEILAVLEEVTARQVNDLRNPEIVRFLVGSDYAVEAEAKEGIMAHPLPPRPGEVLQWDHVKVATLESNSLMPLQAMAWAYHIWANRVEAVLPLQGPAQAPWVREIRDGLRVLALRAEHAVAVYGTALALRAALAAEDLKAVKKARAGVAEARRITEQARAVVYRRERDYRYPDRLTIAGDEPGTEGALVNDGHPFRVLSRTHRMYYWERPDEQLSLLFDRDADMAHVSARILKQGTPVEVRLKQGVPVEVGAEQGTTVDVRLPASAPLGLEMDWDDGNVTRVLERHLYGKQGFYRWVLEAAWPPGAVQREGDAVAAMQDELDPVVVLRHEDDAVVVARRLVFENTSLQVPMLEVNYKQLIESKLPGFVVGLGNDGADFMAVGRIDDEDASVVTRGAIWRCDQNGLISGPKDFELSFGKRGALTVYRARFILEEDAGLALTIEGELATGEIIDIVVKYGEGLFDLESATNMVADILGYTPDTLPERIDIRLEAKGIEE